MSVAARVDRDHFELPADAVELLPQVRPADRQGSSAACPIVIDTDRTDVPMMGLQREPDRVGPSARDPPPDGVSLVPRGNATGASGASEPAHGAGRS
jgi:hypothetical protein